MKAKTSYIVKVEGTGDFPIDMLRYDAATPNSEQDSAIIMDTDHQERRALEVKMYDLPTIARWASFGWRVLETRRQSY